MSLNGSEAPLHCETAYGDNEPMRQQKRYVFHKNRSWFVRYCDDVLQADGTIERKLLCKKLDVPYGDEYRTKASVRQFVDDILAPINGGMLNALSTMLVSEFVERIYLPEYVDKNLRAVQTQQFPSRLAWLARVPPGPCYEPSRTWGRRQDDPNDPAS
jgi:hypothetical protein